MYPKRPGNDKASAYDQWRARVSEGATPSELLAGTQRYAAYTAAENTPTKFIRTATTFYGSGRGYRDGWESKPSSDAVAAARWQLYVEQGFTSAAQSDRFPERIQALEQAGQLPVTAGDFLAELRRVKPWTIAAAGRGTDHAVAEVARRLKAAA